jgi:hypothetical protein
MTDQFDMGIQGGNPTIHNIAFIIDGKIRQILATDPRFAAIMLSDPIMIDVTNIPEATMGADYDQENDRFTPPKPYPSWIYNESENDWDPPVPYPSDGNNYIWSEVSLEWVSMDQVQTIIPD